MSEELRAVIRMEDETSPTVKRVKREVEGMTKSTEKGAKDMDVGFDKLGNRLLSIRSLIGHVSAAYLIMRGIQAFKNMAMEAEDVAAGIRGIAAEWHELLANIAQESSRFWIPIVNSLSRIAQKAFIAARLAFMVMWRDVLTNVKAGLVMFESMTGVLGQALGAGTFKYVIGSLDTALGEATKSIESEGAAWKELPPILGAVATAQARLATGPGSAKEHKKDIAELISNLERLASAYVSTEDKMTSLSGEDSNEANSRIIGLYESQAKATIAALNKLGLNGSKIWGDMVSKIREAGDATTNIKQEVVQFDGFWMDASPGEIAKWVEWKKATERAASAIRTLKNIAKDALNEIADVMANVVISAFDDWIEGSLKPAREYLKQIVRELANFAIQTAFKLAANVVTSSFAGGGVVRGGIEGIPTAAGGAIVRGPRLMVLGDNPSREEAAVPMKNGKIPVEMSGGGRTVNVYIRANDSRSFAQQALNERATVGRVLRRLADERGDAY